MSLTPGTSAWRDRLIALGGNIPQDEDDHPDAVLDAAAEGMREYADMLDAVEGTDDVRVLAAILHSLHPLDDYGVYEAAYSVLAGAAPATLVEAAAAVIPGWLAKHGAHENLGVALYSLLEDEAGLDALVAAAGSWNRDERASFAEAVRTWALEDDFWDVLASRLAA